MNFLLFALGALTMIVELSIPRLIAPAYGNTLFSWTAIISVVLCSMTMGYYLGGQVTEKRKNLSEIIVWCSVISAIWTVCIALLGSSVVQSLSFLNLLIGPLVTSVLFALVPTCLNASIVPMMIATHKQASGIASGKCFSVSTIGSIIGVGITGYFLLPLFGIQGALLSGSVLVLTALFFFRAKKISVIGVLSITALYLWGVQSKLPEDVLVDHSNGYHRIKILEDRSEQLTTRTLYLDNTMEGAVELGITSSYLPGMTKLVHSIESLDSALVIGGGGICHAKVHKKSVSEC